MNIPTKFDPTQNFFCINQAFRGGGDALALEDDEGRGMLRKVWSCDFDRKFPNGKPYTLCVTAN